MAERIKRWLRQWLGLDGRIKALESEAFQQAAEIRLENAELIQRMQSLEDGRKVLAEYVNELQLGMGRLEDRLLALERKAEDRTPVASGYRLRAMIENAGGVR